MAQLQLQALTALVAHAGGVGGIALAAVAIVDGAVHIAVPSAGGIDAEHVALTGTFRVLAGVHQRVVLGNGGAVVHNQSDNLAVHLDLSNLNLTEVRIQRTAVLQNVGVSGDTAYVHAVLVGDLHADYALAVHGLGGVGLDALDVVHRQIGLRGGLRAQSPRLEGVVIDGVLIPSLAGGAAAALQGVGLAVAELGVVHDLTVHHLQVGTVEGRVRKVPAVDAGGGVVALAPVVVDLRGITGETDVLFRPIRAVQLGGEGGVGGDAADVVGVLLAVEGPNFHAGLRNSFPVGVVIASAEGAVVADVRINGKVVNFLVQGHGLTAGVVVGVILLAGQSLDDRGGSHGAAGVALEHDGTGDVVLLNEVVHHLDVVGDEIVDFVIFAIAAGSAGAVVDVDHDSALVGPRGGGGIVQEAGAGVICAVGQLPVGDALPLEGEHDAVGGVIVLGDVVVAADVVVAGAVGHYLGVAGAFDLQVVQILEAVQIVHGLQPLTASELTLVVGQAGSSVLGLARVAQLQLQTGAALVAHVGLVGQIALVRVALAVVDVAGRVAVPGAGGIDAEHVALTDTCAFAGVHQSVVVGDGGAVVHDQGDDLAIHLDLSDLHLAVVRIQRTAVLQDVVAGGDAAHVHAVLVGDFHLSQALAVEGVVGESLDALDVVHRQIGLGGSLIDHDGVVLLKGRGAVVTGDSAVLVLLKAEVLHEVPEDGHVAGIAVVGPQHTHRPLNQRHIGFADGLAPGVYVMPAVHRGHCRSLGREFRINAGSLQHVIGPILERSGFKSIRHIPHIHLPGNQHRGNQFVSCIFTGSGSGRRRTNRCKELRIGHGKALSRRRTGGLAGAIDAGEVQIRIGAVDLLLHQGNEGVVEDVGVRVGHAAGAGAVGLADERQGDALILRDLPPQGGVHEDGVGLAVARIDHQNGQLLTFEALGDVQHVLAGIVFAIVVIVAEGDHAHLYGAVAGNLDVFLSPDLSAVAQGFIYLPVLGILLGGHAGGGVVQTLRQSVGIREGVVVTGVVGQPVIDGRSLDGGIRRHLHLGQAVRGTRRHPADGVVGGIGVGVDALPEHAVGLHAHAVVGGLPVVLAAGVANQISGNGHVLGSHLTADAHLSQGLVQHLGDVAVGAGAVIGLAGHGSQGVCTDAGAVHIGLADDEDGVLSRPQLQRSAAGAVARHVELTEGGEHVLAVDVVGALQEGDGRLHIGALLFRGTPAVGAGLQNEQALALLVGQVNPALILQELLRVHLIGHSHDGEVGADGSLGSDVDLHSPVVVEKVAVAVYIDVLGVVAGQGQLGRLRVVVRQIFDAVEVGAFLSLDCADLYSIASSLKSRGAVIPGDGAVRVLHEAVVLQEVPQDGHLAGIAVVRTQQGLAVLNQRNAGVVGPGVDLGAVVDKLMLVFRGADGGIGQTVHVKQVLNPVLKVLGTPQVRQQVAQVALARNDHSRDGLIDAVGSPDAGGGGHRSKELGVGPHEALRGHGTGRLTGRVDPGEVQVGIGAVHGLFHHGNERLIEQIRIHVRDAGGGAVGLTDHHGNKALLLRNLPPLGGIQEDGVGLAVAGVDDQDGQLLTLEAIGDVSNVLAGVLLAVVVVVVEGDHAHLHGAVVGNFNGFQAPNLGLAVGLVGHAVQGVLLSSHTGGSVVQTIGQGVGVSEGIVVPGVDGQPIIDRLGIRHRVRHLHLRDAMLSILRQLRVGISGLRCIGIFVLVVHAVHRTIVAVVGGKPVRHIIRHGAAGKPGGNRHILAGDLRHTALFQNSEELFVSLEARVIAAGVGAVVEGGSSLIQHALFHTGTIHIGLADDKNGVRGGPELQRSRARAIAHQIELAIGGEHGNVVGVSRTLQEADGRVNIVALFLGRAPAVFAGLQDEQALALLIRQVDPAVGLQELIGIHAVGHRNHGEVRPDGGLFGDIDLHGTGLAVYVDVLGVVAGQRQLSRLGPIGLQLGDAVKVRGIPLAGSAFLHGVKHLLGPLGYALGVDGVSILTAVEVPLVGVVVVLFSAVVGILHPGFQIGLVRIIPNVQIGLIQILPRHDLGHGVVGLAPLLELPGVQAGGADMEVDPLLALAGFPVQLLHDLNHVLLRRGVVAVGLAVEHPDGDAVVDHGLDLFFGPAAQAAVFQGAVNNRGVAHSAQVAVAFHKSGHQVGTLTDQVGGDQGALRVAHHNDPVLVHVPVGDGVVQHTGDFRSGIIDRSGMDVHAHDNGVGHLLVPLGHHHVVHHVAAQVVGRILAVVLPVADAAAALVDNGGIGLRPVCIIPLGVDHLNGDQALGAFLLVHLGIALGFPAYIDHFQHNLIQAVGENRLFPHGHVVGEHITHAISGEDTVINWLVTNSQNQVQISPLEALVDVVGKDLFPDAVLLHAVIVNVAFVVNVPVGAGAQSAVSLAGTVGDLVGPLVHDQRNYIVIDLGVGDLQFAEFRVVEAAVPDGIGAVLHIPEIGARLIGDLNRTYLVAVKAVDYSRLDRLNRVAILISHPV